MSTPYVGEIRIFGGNFAPQGWALCNGALLPISENDALFSLIGTTYGGDGQSTFALPDLRGRVPIHQGSGAAGAYVIGEQAGTESVTLTTAQIPSHSHTVGAASTGGTSDSPAGAVVAGTGVDDQYAAPGSSAVMASGVVGAATPAGGSQPHDNMQPSLAINYIIALFGIYPSPT